MQTLRRPRPLPDASTRSPAESWKNRVLLWVYPCRGWGNARPVAVQEPLADRAKEPRSSSARPAAFRGGGAA